MERSRLPPEVRTTGRGFSRVAGQRLDPDRRRQRRGRCTASDEQLSATRRTRGTAFDHWQPATRAPAAQSRVRLAFSPDAMGPATARRPTRATRDVESSTRRVPRSLPTATRTAAASALVLPRSWDAGHVQHSGDAPRVRAPPGSDSRRVPVREHRTRLPHEYRWSVYERGKHRGHCSRSTCDEPPRRGARGRADHADHAQGRADHPADPGDGRDHARGPGDGDRPRHTPVHRAGRPTPRSSTALLSRCPPRSTRGCEMKRLLIGLLAVVSADRLRRRCDGAAFVYSLDADRGRRSTALAPAPAAAPAAPAAPTDPTRLRLDEIDAPVVPLDAVRGRTGPTRRSHRARLVGQERRGSGTGSPCWLATPCTPAAGPSTTSKTCRWEPPRT